MCECKDGTQDRVSLGVAVASELRGRICAGVRICAEQTRRLVRRDGEQGGADEQQEHGVREQDALRPRLPRCACASETLDSERGDEQKSSCACSAGLLMVLSAWTYCSPP
jgi:hypothetical protein